MTNPLQEAPDIRAVLDRSAIQSYGLGHIHVGEMLIEIADAKGHAGIPATALLDAHSSFADDKVARARLRMLVLLPAAAMLDLDAISADSIADTRQAAEGDLSRAHSVWAALKHSAIYLTTEPEQSARMMDGDRIIAIPREDA
ncbi:hypothetical protein ACFQFC_29795 [Amorphoplanes digitatis]|uniref:Uncharacterized protein n=1 Tax=Actinoplanes digitatis TaxID=1868 RepID=A0A7W7MMV0_9ACTN|nr:hypothetical protein [Actinoplanes digitatis]MBB4760341.1 hypothetical protein [Actinoplanes digitatis]BFE68453.1 hypothetical protein GCM10020092_017540 [Actinoplanes digitatis]GID97475.1 hypothetical protein Adi01nite_68870 [Actinoplanes digitatis]